MNVAISKHFRRHNLFSDYYYVNLHKPFLELDTAYSLTLEDTGDIRADR